MPRVDDDQIADPYDERLRDHPADPHLALFERFAPCWSLAAGRLPPAECRIGVNLFASRMLRLRHVALIAVAALTAACGSKSSPTGPTPPPSSGGTVTVPIMGAARLSAPQIVAWFNGRQPRPPGTYAATVPVEVLAQSFVEEGAAEGVTGDVAFMQSIVETAWFRFSGSVPASSNNFAGIGATDTNPNPAVFPDAQTGVRAQIQHLRAYAGSRGRLVHGAAAAHPASIPGSRSSRRRAGRPRGTRWVTATGRPRPLTRRRF